MAESHGGGTSKRHRESSGVAPRSAIPSQSSLPRPENGLPRRGRRSSALRGPSGIAPADSDTSVVRRHAGETRDCPENDLPQPREASAGQAASALLQPRSSESSLNPPRSYHDPPRYLFSGSYR